MNRYSPNTEIGYESKPDTLQQYATRLAVGLGSIGIILGTVVGGHYLLNKTDKHEPKPQVAVSTTLSDLEKALATAPRNSMILNQGAKSALETEYANECSQYLKWPQSEKTTKQAVELFAKEVTTEDISNTQFVITYPELDGKRGLGTRVSE